jgi:hypothetical protein
MNPLDITPEEFRRLSTRVLEIAVDYLEGMDARSIPPAGRGAEIERLYRAPWPETGLREEALADLQDVARHSRTQNGRFFGYVLGSGEPAAAAADFLCSVLNQNVTALRSAPAAVSLERTVVDWLAQAVACPNFRGILTVARGRVYLSNATLHSKFCLRACIVNHRTTDADIDAIPCEVLSAAEEVLHAAGSPPR